MGDLTMLRIIPDKVLSDEAIFLMVEAVEDRMQALLSLTEAPAGLGAQALFSDDLDRLTAVTAYTDAAVTAAMLQLRAASFTVKDWSSRAQVSRLSSCTPRRLCATSGTERRGHGPTVSGPGTPIVASSFVRFCRYRRFCDRPPLARSMIFCPRPNPCYMDIAHRPRADGRCPCPRGARRSRSDVTL